MGSRANFIILDDSGLELYYDHWGAQGLALDLLFDGPGETLRRVRSMTRCDPGNPDHWLDDRWAEGGLVMDLRAKTLRWFDFESVSPRLACHLLEITWPGWTPAWCPEGMHGFLPLPGLTRAMLEDGCRLRPERFKKLSSLDPVRTIGGTVPGDRFNLDRSLVSIRFDDGTIRSVVFGEEIQVVTQFRAEWVVDYVRRLSEPATAGEPPMPQSGYLVTRAAWASQGMVIDLPGHDVTWWSHGGAFGHMPSNAASNWPAFTVMTCGDNHEWHQRQVGVRIHPTDMNLAEDANTLRHAAERRDLANPGESTAEALRAAGLDVVTNPEMEAFVPSRRATHRRPVLAALADVLASGRRVPPARYVGTDGSIVEPAACECPRRGPT